MNHTSFFQHIKKNDLSGAYLLHGEEEYIKDQALDALLSTVDGAAKELNIQFFDSADARALREACEMLPFFSEKRIIVCRALPQKGAWDELAKYIPTMPASSLLIFVARGKASDSLSIVKAMEAKDRLVDFQTLKENEAAKWVCKQAQKYPVHISPASASFLVKLVGCPLYALGNEFVKAAGYAGEGNTITNEIILKAVTKNIEYGVFAMRDYFIAGKTADGLRALSVLLEREGAFQIAALMARHYKLMLRAKLLAEQGLDKNTAIKKLGDKPYVAKDAYESARRYSKEKLIENIIAFSEVGYKQISGQMKDKEALELAMLNCKP